MHNLSSSRSESCGLVRARLRENNSWMSSAPRAPSKPESKPKRLLGNPVWMHKSRLASRQSNSSATDNGGCRQKGISGENKEMESWEDWDSPKEIPNLIKKDVNREMPNDVDGSHSVGVGEQAVMLKPASDVFASTDNDNETSTTYSDKEGETTATKFLDSSEYADYARELITARPLLLANARLAVGSTSKSLTKDALNRIQQQLSDTLHADFKNRLGVMFASGLCFHTDSSCEGKRSQHDKECLEMIFKGDRFLIIEYPPQYVGSTELASHWETVTRRSPWCSVMMLVSCIRESQKTLEWKSAMVEEVYHLALRQHKQIERRQEAYSKCFERWDNASKLLTEARSAWIKFQEKMSDSLGEKEATRGETVNTRGGTTVEVAFSEAQRNIASAKIALSEANASLERLRVRENRRTRRMERRRLQERATRKAVYKDKRKGGADVDRGDRVAAAREQGSDFELSSGIHSDLRGMSLLDKIIASVFSAIPLGQRLPFEVFRNLSEKTQSMNIPKSQEEHFKLLLEAQLRIRHEWEANFEYVPLHEFDDGVNSNTDSDSEKEEEESEQKPGEFTRAYSSFDDTDSGSDGWRARGGHIFVGDAGEDAPDPDGDYGYFNDDDFDDDTDD